MHVGRNVEVVRSFRGISKTEMAHRLDLAPEVYEQIERSEDIIDEVLNRIASEVDLDAEFIRWAVNAGATYNNIQNNNTQDSSTGGDYINNPVEKIVELYERLLESEKEKVRLLQEQHR